MNHLGNSVILTLISNKASTMAATPTTQIPLGFKASPFLLPDVISGEQKSYETLRGDRATAVVFMCNHCPFVVHIIDELISVVSEYLPKGVGFILISSNDVVNYPQDNPDRMADFARHHNFPVAYLYDETQEVAKAYDAACTPDFAVFNHDDICVYRGQFDSARPGNHEEVNGTDLRMTLDTLLEGGAVSPEGQKPSIGCNIKWK
jgi:thiol-disulfide isomerase/thioredoxin